jgi:glycerol-3-phosphate dehydrogenase
MTAAENGAVLLNYAKVVLINKNDEGSIDGVGFVDAESGDTFFARAKCVINATGAFSDSIRKMSDENSQPIIAPSQGIHLVFEQKFLSGKHALMIPKTSDGRVLFAIPWHDHLVVGTTETEIPNVSPEPRALEDEISFLLETCKEYFSETPRREDILSVFTGIRPLVKGGSKNPARLSRDHFIEINEAKLLTITGGKWTTYRKMAEDTIDQAASIAKLSQRESKTREIRVHGFCRETEEFGDLGIYGSDVNEIKKLIAQDKSLGEKIHARLPYTFAEVLWAVRNEMARTLEDVLARRTRALFLDARAAIESAPRVVEIISKELKKDSYWSQAQLEDFRQLAAGYMVI